MILRIMLVTMTTVSIKYQDQPFFNERNGRQESIAREKQMLR